MITDENPKPVERLASVDAYRGFVMFLMMAEVLNLRQVARAVGEGSFWQFLAYHQTHVEWIGCSLHDLIQPSFSFLVGVALPFSIASRRLRGQSLEKMLGHACWRAIVLVLLGVFLRSLNKSQTNYTFEDTLSQIGLGYVFLFLLGLAPVRVQWLALGVILVGYWGAFAAYTPPADLDTTKLGVPADWPHRLSGFAAHWNKNANAAWAFDTWFLNRFPRPKPFAFNGGGYCTLSFIPTLATMILGLLAGEVLRSARGRRAQLNWLIAAGAVTLLAGWALGIAGICPVVKRIWTPSWVLFSGGWCFLILAGFFTVMDIAGWRGWAFPLVVIGMNSIAAYCLAHLIEPFIVKNFRTFLGPDTFLALGPAYEPLLRGLGVLLVLWLILFWMYRRKIFLRI